MAIALNPELRLTREQSVLRGGLLLVVVMVAIVPRVFGLGQFITNDEANFWMRRSAQFLAALGAGDFAGTAISTHPGVTTTWLGGAGLLLHDALRTANLVDSSFATQLGMLQLPVALVNALGIVLGYLLLRKMFQPVVATLAALLWALDPFVIDYSRLLHVDMLAGTFLTLSVLAACVAWNHAGGRRWVVVSGVCAGLALLSKSPAAIVCPTVGLVALLGRTKDEGPEPKAPKFGKSALVFGFWSFLRPLVGWGLVVGLTVFALWPALWVAPLRPYELVRLGVEGEGAVPHMLGNFFLGRQDDAPGPLFYPVAVALRLTPWSMLGVILLAWVWRDAPTPARRDVVALAALAVLFVVALSYFPKKFNRYLLPSFPALDILAAAGIVWGSARLAGALQRSGRVHLAAAARTLVAGLVVLAATATAYVWRSHTLAYFNPLLGGAAAGVRTFSVGWGEGLEQAADWLNQQPDITGVLVASTNVPTLQPYLRPGAQSVTPSSALPNQTGYVVVNIADVQGGAPWPPFDQFYGRQEPVKTIALNGVDYVWIYQAPPPVAQSRAATFGDQLELRGFEPASPAQPGQLLRYKLFWHAKATPAFDPMIFVHLLDQGGKRYAQADLPLVAGQWQARRFYTAELGVQLPADLPPACYQLVIGLYDPGSQQRIPITTAIPITPALDGPDALPLAMVCTS
jgi:4-amino-4-deoxy-L-arabinose transferase-like glycosyltransferase